MGTLSTSNYNLFSGSHMHSLMKIKTTNRQSLCINCLFKYLLLLIYNSARVNLPTLEIFFA